MKTILKNSRSKIKLHQLRLGRVLAGIGIPEYSILTVFSLILGTAAGLAGVGLHEAIHFLSGLFFTTSERSNQLGLFIILIPVAGMLIQSLMTHLAPTRAKHKGVLEIIKCVGQKNGHMSLRSTLFHFFAPAICIGTGGTVGPEAPAAQTGAGVVSYLGRLMGLSDSRQRIFTAAGAGAAIAAIFNSPLGGVFFAIEVVLLQDFRASALSVFLLASVAASAVSRIILGNEPAFIFDKVIIGPYKLYVFYLLAGIGAGLLSVIFIRSNEWIKSGCNRIFRIIPKPVAMGLIGLLMGLAGYWQPGIWGIGYDSMNQILSNGLSIQTVSILLILKFVLVSLILGVGGYGGVFAPSLFVGGCFGYIFAFASNQLFGLALDPTTYTLVGMGSVLAGINAAPLTGIMLLFEMTNDYHFILPLMLGVVASSIVVQMAVKGSLHGRELIKQGYLYFLGRDTRILQTINVVDVPHKEILTVPEHTTLAQLIKNSLEKPHDTIYTTDANGKINGLIRSSTLHQLITEYQQLKEMVIAKDLSEPQVPLVRENENLDQAMHLFSKYRVEEIPIISSNSNARIVGTIHYQDVLKAYNNAKVKYNLTDGLAEDLKTLNPNESQDVLPGFSILELEIPKSFINKTIQDLRVRNRFDIELVMIEKDMGKFDNPDEVKRIFPHVNYKFVNGDRIVVFGKNEKVQKFKEYVGTS